MEPTTYLNSIKEDQSEKIEKILVDLGYNLSDGGKYWRCNAVYRDGDNRTALQIWKNSGIWKDFVVNTKYQPFSRLLQLSCQDDSKLNEMLESLKSGIEDSFIPVIKAPKMEIDQYFSHDEIKTLLPHYIFYNKKGISDKTLKLYNSGFSMSGKMNGRFVFPIFDENSKVVGISGRHLLWEKNNKLPKWKHLGRKANWIYPVNMSQDVDNVFKKTIEEKRELILVEGIGDSLALSEQGFYNHLVVFGLEISSKQLSYLMSLSIDKIIIATNNDKDKISNRGLSAAIKIYLKLIKFFDVSKIEIKLPILKDFGEMLENNIDISEWVNKKISKKKQVEYIIKSLHNQKQDKNVLILENYLEQLNFERNTVGE